MDVPVRRSVHPRIRRSFPRSLATAVVLLSAMACSPSTSNVTALPGAPASSTLSDRRAQLFTADEMLRRGCYDCLREALAAYEGLVDDPTMGARARDARTS